MSIKLSAIEIIGRVGKEFVHVRARLLLENEISTTKPAIVIKQKQILKEAVMKNQKVLKQSVIHFIYGDLIEPINELAILAQFHITGQHDAKEIKELRATIDKILKGE